MSEKRWCNQYTQELINMLPETLRTYNAAFLKHDAMLRRHRIMLWCVMLMSALAFAFSFVAVFDEKHQQPNNLIHQPDEKREPIIAPASVMPIAQRAILFASFALSSDCAPTVDIARAMLLGKDMLSPEVGGEFPEGYFEEAV